MSETKKEEATEKPQKKNISLKKEADFFYTLTHSAIIL